MPDLYREPTDEGSAAEALGVPPPVSLSSVETEIAELEKQLVQKRAMIGAGKYTSAEASAKAERPIEQAIGAEKPAPSVSAASQQMPAAPAPINAVAPKEEADKFKGLEKNQQLKNLVDLAFQKGIDYAAEVAREMDSAYLMDEFHDTLVDQLHKELVERGKLEEI